MNIVVCCKVTPDDQDIQIAPDSSLDFSRAKLAVSPYDLNALEAAVQVAQANEGAHVTAVSAGDVRIDDSKLKKNILARGIDELVMAAADGLDGMDARATAEVLAGALADVQADLIVCGDGSADEYAQQVDVQLAERLGLPAVTAVSSLAVEGSKAVCVRALEDCVETVEVDLPAVVSVTPDAATPRIPGARDILSAGKKPSRVIAPEAPACALSTVECGEAQKVARACEVVNFADEGALEKLVSVVRAAC